jgi:hypothetical protein
MYMRIKRAVTKLLYLPDRHMALSFHSPSLFLAVCTCACRQYTVVNVNWFRVQLRGITRIVLCGFQSPSHFHALLHTTEKNPFVLPWSESQCLSGSPVWLLSSVVQFSTAVHFIVLDLPSIFATFRGFINRQINIYDS